MITSRQRLSKQNPGGGLTTKKHKASLNSLHFSCLAPVGVEEGTREEVRLPRGVPPVPPPHHLHLLVPHSPLLVRVVQPTEEQSVISHPEFGGRHDVKSSHSYFFHSLCKHVRLLQAVTKRINLPGNTGPAALSKIIIEKSAKQKYSRRSRGQDIALAFSYFNPKAMLSMMAV